MPKRSRIPLTVSTIHRCLFVGAFGATGFVVGREVDVQLIALHIESGFWQGVCRLVMPVVGSLGFVAIAPFAQGLFEQELAAIEAASEYLSPLEVIGATIGLCVGLFVALLLRALFAGIINVIGMAAEAILILAAVLFCACTTYLGLRIGGRSRKESDARLQATVAAEYLAVLDTSAIIDGRVLEIVRCGFLAGPLLVPRFILAELQNVADAADPVRRARGRRGLEILGMLQGLIEIRIEGEVLDNGGIVDLQLVRFARERRAHMITTDYNLNQVARLEGVKVMNVNELAQALRPAVATGQVMDVAVTKEGREADQGVGYLADGTMIVIDGGRAFVGGTISVVVTSVLQNAAGRMVFARAQ